jgi:predicted  nucleic acid-binding Zn-ribbon protein
MACVTCTEASDAPQHHRFFAEGCLHCAARRIQFIQRRLNLAPDAIRNRCRTALAQAMALGLPEQEIRAMAKKTEWQLQ